MEIDPKVDNVIYFCNSTCKVSCRRVDAVMGTVHAVVVLVGEVLNMDDSASGHLI